MKFKSVHVQENVKVTDIKDALNRLKYKVTLTAYDINDDAWGTIYQIQVINFFSAPDPLIILTRPNNDEQPIDNYREALQIYNDCVKNYTNLVKAETRDFQDIDIYKTKIDYKITEAKCCGTCKWCQQRAQPKNDFIYGVSNKLECTNPLNETEYKFDMIHTDKYGHIHQTHHFPRPPFFKSPHEEHLGLRPNVEILGLCKNYEPRKSHIKLEPGDSISEIVNKCCNQFHKENINQEMADISANIITLLSTELDTNVVDTVSTHIATSISTELANKISDDIATGISTDLADTLSVNIATAISTDITTELTTTVVATVSTELANNLTDDVITVISTNITNELTTDIITVISTDLGETLSTDIIHKVGEKIEQQLTSNKLVIDGNHEEPIYEDIIVGGGTS